MRAHVVTFAALIVAANAGAAHSASSRVIMTAISADGVGKRIGALRLSDTKAGLQIIPFLTGLPPGDHGFHVHINPNCGAGHGPDGQPAAGMAAGGHYDPANTDQSAGTNTSKSKTQNRLRQWSLLRRCWTIPQVHVDQ